MSSSSQLPASPLVSVASAHRAATTVTAAGASPAEFVAGAVKSNNIQLLFTFQKAFQLQGTGN